MKYQSKEAKESFDTNLYHMIQKYPTHTVWEYDNQRNFINQRIDKESFDLIYQKIQTNHKNYIHIKNTRYPNGSFLGLEPIKFLTREQENNLFTKWLIANKKAIQGKCKPYNEDAFQDALLYVCEKINSQSGVNNFEATIIFKYQKILLDNQRIDKKSRDCGLSKDFNISFDSIESNDLEYLSYIDHAATVSLFDNASASNDTNIPDDEISCIDEVNDMVMFRLIKDFLGEHFKQKIIEIFIEYISIKGTHAKSFVINKSKELNIGRSTLYRMLSDMLNLLKIKSNDFLINHLIIRYPKIGDITLKNIIFD